jgi:hypothetical protein
MEPLYHPPSEKEVLKWVFGYEISFTIGENETLEPLATVERMENVSSIYR